MSSVGFNDIGQLDCLYTSCPPPPICPVYVVNYVSPIIAWAQSFPWIMTCAFLATEMWNSQVFFFFTKLLLFVDWFFNWGLRIAFAIPKSVVGCTPVDVEGPSFNAEHVTIYFTTWWMYHAIYRRPKLSTFQVLMVAGLASMVLYSRIYVGMADARHIALGHFFGVCFTLFFQLFIYRFTLWKTTESRIKRYFEWKQYDNTMLSFDESQTGQYSDDDESNEKRLKSGAGVAYSNEYLID